MLADPIENFEYGRVKNWALPQPVRLGGAVEPDGNAPIDMQLSFLFHRRELRRAVRRMIDRAPDKIVLAHGAPYPRNGTAELKRAFRWVF